MDLENIIKIRQKLIEVSIPLDVINESSAKEKNIRHGNMSSLHLWWARRPVAAARAIIFCQLIDDPSSVPEEFPDQLSQDKERLRLFDLLSELVKWENSNNTNLISKAKIEIRKSWERCCSDNSTHAHAKKLFNPDILPSFYDPFAGGGALPLEAQRLGLKSCGSDLNPVAVLINKSMIQLPCKFKDMKPINKKENIFLGLNYKGTEGLREDIKYYGDLLRELAISELGQIYPKVKITDEIIKQRPDLKKFHGQDLKIVAWIWTKTIKSPNPAFNNIKVPLTSNFFISSKKNHEAFIEIIINSDSYRFEVKIGKPNNIEKAKEGTKAGRGIFRCIMSGDLIDNSYIKKEANKGQIDIKLMAMVIDLGKGTTYLSPQSNQEEICGKILNEDLNYDPSLNFDENAMDFRVKAYGINNWQQLFTSRQFKVLSTLSKLIEKVVDQVSKDISNSNLNNEEKSKIKKDYPIIIGVYLSFVISRLADFNSTLCGWIPAVQATGHSFSRQAISMVWDFAEINIFGDRLANYNSALEKILNSIKIALPINSLNCIQGEIMQLDAASKSMHFANSIISTDPPYFDNIGYADLSDFFYFWLRKSLKKYIPELFASVNTPKKDEIIANKLRHGSKDNASRFFLNGMIKAIGNIKEKARDDFPITIYYAFKQSETSSDGNKTSSTGWEKFLEAIIKSNLVINGTWPIRTELMSRMRGKKSNALSTSVVLVCRKALNKEKTISRNEFKRYLKEEMPKAIRNLKISNIAPVDLAQASIGPGISIFSKYKAVIKPDDTFMNVKEALIEINSTRDEILNEDYFELDPETSFAITFFESFGFNETNFGEAENLAKARNISVSRIVEFGIMSAHAGIAKLKTREELLENWDPKNDSKICIWEATQYLIKKLEIEGELAAADLFSDLKEISGHGDLTNNCRSLAYRIYNHCEKTNQAEEARSYNNLIIAWTDLENLAAKNINKTTIQSELL